MKRLKKLLSFLLCAAILTGMLGVLPALPSVSAAQPQSQDDLKYTKDSNGEIISILGWEGDLHAAYAYPDGSYYLRARGDGLFINFGVPGIHGDIDWYNKEGYLPCLVSEYQKDGMNYTVENFGDKVTINGNDYVVMYSRFTCENTTNEEQSLPGVTSNLIPLNGAAKNATSAAAGETVVRDYCIGADRFGQKYGFPSAEELAAAGGFDEHYTHMRNYWNTRLSGVVDIKKVPSGYEELINAYKAGYIYTLITADGDGLHTGENAYDKTFDHDSIGILAALVELGHTDNFAAYASHILDNVDYDDARWKFPWPFALYLQKTGDKETVRAAFEEIKKNARAIEADRTGRNGMMKQTVAIDSYGYWLVDNWSALTGLASYAYICDTLGETAEAAWAKEQYAALKAGIEKSLVELMGEYNDFSYLPMSVERPNLLNGRRSDPGDANWAASFLFGRWAWDGYLLGADQDGMMIDLIDDTYSYGFYRREAAGIDDGDTFGGYPNYSSAYNAGYASAALRGEEYRGLGIKAYLWMIENSMSGPYSWWENVHYPGDSRDPATSWNWSTPHIGGGGGSCPHMWGQANNTKVLIDSLMSEKVDSTRIIGRGVPKEWIASGEEIAADNFPVAGGKRMGFSITAADNVVTLHLTGDTSAPVSLELPSLVKNIASVEGGLSFDNEKGAVSVPAGTAVVKITLKDKNGWQNPDYEAEKAAQKQAFQKADAPYQDEGDYGVLFWKVQSLLESDKIVNIQKFEGDPEAAEIVAVWKELDALKEKPESYSSETNAHIAQLLKKFDEILADLHTFYGAIPKLSQNQAAFLSIDAEKDALYENAVTVKINQFAVGQPQNETSGLAHLVWSQGYLYCYAEIADKSVVIPSDEELQNSWDCESLDFYLNPNASENWFDVTGYRVGVTGYPSVFTCGGHPNYFDYEGTQVTEEMMERAARVTDTGYAVEFKIPVSLEAGQTVGIQFMLNDKFQKPDGSVGTTYIRAQNFTYGDTWNGYGTVKLGDTAAKKESLLQAIEYANGQKAKPGYENVIPASKTVFEKALSNAEAVYADKNATQAQVDAAVVELIDAVHDLALYKGDKAELLKLIKTADALDLAGFLPAGQEEFKAALTEAKKVFDDENAVQDEVDAAAKALEIAIANLFEKPDKHLLKQAIELAEGLDLTKYVDKGKAELAIELREAKKVYDNEAATKEQVAKATKDLNAAILALRRAANKENLAAVIAKAEALNAADYTPESFEAVTLALGTANAMMADNTLSEKDQARVDAAEAVLAAAIENLVKASTDTPGNPDVPDNPDTPDDPKGNNTPTSDTTPLLGLGLLTLFGGAALILCRKKAR